MMGRQCLPILLTTVLLFPMGCNDEGGEITLHITRTLPTGHNLRALHIPIARVAVQPQFEARDTGIWRNLTPTTSHYDLIQDVKVKISQGSPPPDSYHRIFVEIEDLELEAITQQGNIIPVLNHVEPIAVPFVVNDANNWRITLDLILVQDLDVETPSYTLYCRDVAIQPY